MIWGGRGRGDGGGGGGGRLHGDGRWHGGGGSGRLDGGQKPWRRRCIARWQAWWLVRLWRRGPWQLCAWPRMLRLRRLEKTCVSSTTQHVMSATRITIHARMCGRRAGLQGRR